MTKQEAIELVDELVEEIRGLRAAVEKSEARLLARLCEIEAEHLETIKLAGCTSFAQWLVSAQLVSVNRYENFKAGVLALGGKVEDAIELGANPTMALAKVRDASKVQTFVAAVRETSGETGVAPSEQAARRLLRQVDPREEVPESLRKKSRIQELEEENAMLRVENRKLKAQVKKLERDLGKARKAA